MKKIANELNLLKTAQLHLESEKKKIIQNELELREQQLKEEREVHSKELNQQRENLIELQNDMLKNSSENEKKNKLKIIKRRKEH